MVFLMGFGLSSTAKIVPDRGNGYGNGNGRDLRKSNVSDMLNKTDEPPIFSRACQLLLAFARAVHLPRVTGEEGTLQQEILPPKYFQGSTCSGQSLIFLVQEGQASEGWEGKEESLAVFLLTHSFLTSVRCLTNMCLFVTALEKESISGTLY